MPTGAPTTVVILGVDHSLQLVSEAYQPAVFRAFFERVRPDALCIERPPHEYVQGGSYAEYAYEWRHIAVPWAREQRVPLYAVDWVPPAEDQRLVWGVSDIDAPPFLRTEGSARPFLTFGAEAQGRALFFAEEPAAAEPVAAWYDQPRQRGERDFPRRLGLYRTFLQAMRIKAVARQHPGQLVLVVIGYFHKGDIERVLDGAPGLVMRQPSTFGHPDAKEIAAAARSEDLFAILSFTLLGLQARAGAVDWDWISRVLARVERETEEVQSAPTTEAQFFRTRYGVVTHQLGAAEAIGRYEAVRAAAATEQAFTFTGVVDGSRVDSYYDPFGNLRLVQRALLETAREHHKLGHPAAAEHLRTQLLGDTRLSALQRAQADGYWDEYVWRTP